MYVQDKPLEQLDRKYFAKGSGVFQNKGSASNSKDKGSMRFIALMECKIQKLCELLKEVYDAFSCIFLMLFWVAFVF